MWVKKVKNKWYIIPFCLLAVLISTLLNCSQIVKKKTESYHDDETYLPTINGKILGESISESKDLELCLDKSNIRARDKIEFLLGKTLNSFGKEWQGINPGLKNKVLFNHFKFEVEYFSTPHIRILKDTTWDKEGDFEMIGCKVMAALNIFDLYTAINRVGSQDSVFFKSLLSSKFYQKMEVEVGNLWDTAN